GCVGWMMGVGEGDVFDDTPIQTPVARPRLGPNATFALANPFTEKFLRLRLKESPIITRL
ncbi:MAG: hypothetical protein WCI46_14645, partial [Verrucomicrobiota bacterium]